MIGVTIWCNRGKEQEIEIGICLFISEETVKAHMKHILEKLGASDRTQAVTIAARSEASFRPLFFYLTVAPLMNARMSALITSAFVVIMPCGKPG